MAVLKLAVVLFLERCSANAGKMIAGGIQEEHSKTNGQVEVGVVVPERVRPNGHVKVAGGVVGKRRRTNRHVETAGSIVMKRIETDSGIGDAASEAEQSVIALSGVGAGIAAIRCRGREKRLRSWRKRKAGEQQQHEKQTASQRRPANRICCG